MSDPAPFLQKVVLQHYKSIGLCSVELGPLNFLVGPNGAGKSNFLDALRFTADSLKTSLEHALRKRGGIQEVRKRSAGRPTNFGVDLYWRLPTGESGRYAFKIGARSGESFEVQREWCLIHDPKFGAEPETFDVRSGQVHSTTLKSPPAAAHDRLFLVAASGQPQFRPLYDALVTMGLYNFTPTEIRNLQASDLGEVLADDGHNLASVLKRLVGRDGKERNRVTELLGRVVPGISGVSHKQMGKKETIEFDQWTAGQDKPWKFDAESMSDGTLRALAILVALFQPPSTDGRPVRVVGIEEPESALHPGAAGVLRSALFEASRTRQVIVTSHSPDLLDDKQVPAESILAVSHQDGETMLGPVDEASRASIRDRLFTAGELLRLNQLVSDPAVLLVKDSPQLELFRLP